MVAAGTANGGGCLFYFQGGGYLGKQAGQITAFAPAQVTAGDYVFTGTSGDNFFKGIPFSDAGIESVDMVFDALFIRGADVLSSR